MKLQFNLTYLLALIAACCLVALGANRVLVGRLVKEDVLGNIVFASGSFGGFAFPQHLTECEIRHAIVDEADKIDPSHGFTVDDIYVTRVATKQGMFGRLDFNRYCRTKRFFNLVNRDYEDPEAERLNTILLEAARRIGGGRYEPAGE